MGMNKQNKTRKIRDAVDMSKKDDLATHPEPGIPRWTRPSVEECDEPELPYKGSLPGGDPERVRLLTRLRSHTETGVLVNFALILQAFDRSQWFTVAEIDSCHDLDVHLHKYGRSRNDRVGNQESLRSVTCLDDVQDGYSQAHSFVETNWNVLVEGWNYA